VSLRARYQRYRRFGLDPLPEDAGVAQREARIAEVRALRRRRQRTIALRSGIGTLALVVLAALLLYWLLMTIGGRDLLLRQIVARLPAGTELTWESAEGPASGPMVLRGVHFSMPRQRDPDCVPSAQASCAMGRIVLNAEQVTVDPALRPLLGRTLRLDTLDIVGTTLDLPRSDKPFELPRWPEVLPRIELPLALQADSIRIDDLKVVREGDALVDIRSARGGLDAAPGSLHIEHLLIDSDRGRLTVHGDYIPRENFRSDLLATAVLPAPAGQTAPRFGLLARGDLSKMDVSIGGRAPAPLRAVLTLRGDADRPRWQSRATSDALDIGLLNGSGEASTPLAFDIKADGTGGNANLRGTVRQGDFAATLQPSRLSLEDRVLRLQPLVVDVLGGRITASGTADLRGAGEATPGQFPIRMAANARGLRWQGEDGQAMVGGDADFGIAGTVDRWAVKGLARLQRGQERATIDVTGNGFHDRMQVTALRASMPQGRLDASGDVAWSPRLSWTAKATLAGFDPGYLAPDWPGAVNGVVQSSGMRRDNGALRADVEAGNLGGTLRGRALRGRGTLNIDGDNYAGEVALSLGGSRIDARGRIAAGIDIDANLSPLQLNDLLPDGRGSVRGRLKLRGARNAPDIDVDLRGDGAAFGDYRAERFVAKGRLPWRGDKGMLAVDAQGLQVGLPLGSVRAGLRGSVERLQFDADAQSEFGALTLRGNANKQGTRWQGALAALQFDPPKGAAWSLQQPARWSWDGSSGGLSRACLPSSAGGTLCLDADWPRRGLDLQGEKFPLAMLVPYLPERSDGRPWVFSGEAAFTTRIVPVGNAWRGTASITSAAGGIRNRPRARRDVVGYRDLTLEASFDPQRISATLGAVFNDDGRIHARIGTGWDAYAPLSGEVRVNIDDLTWMELFSPDIVEPTGRLDVDLRLSGTRAAPAIGGEGRLQDFATELPSLGIELRDGDLRLQARADGNARIRGRVRSGDGVLDVDGTLGSQAQDTPLVLSLRGTDVLVSNTRQLRAVANPDLVVRHRVGQPLQVSGAVTVPEADIHLDRLDQGVSASDDVVVLDPADPKRERINGLGLDLDLALAMGGNVNIDGFGLVGTLGGSLRVREAPDREMRGTGALEVDGRYSAYGQRLQITRGRLVWANTPIGDPRLDIRAEREVGDVTAGIRVEGRASAPRATVYSDPAKSESEALAYLTLGRPLSRLTGEEARRLGTAKTALSAGTGLLAAELGTRIGLDDAGVVESRALGSEVLSIGKYLSPKLYVGYGVSLLGTGQVLMLKYLLRKGFDIQIESSTVENRASVNWRTEK
jgi:translocation and assembly module TamB